MTTYISRQIQIKVSEKRNGEEILLQRGDRPVRFDAVDELNEVRAERYVLSAPVTDKDLMEGSNIAAGKILILETDTELTVKLNDVGDTGITVKPVVDADRTTKRGTLYLEGDFTKVYVTVGGTEEAVVLVGIVGQ